MLQRDLPLAQETVLLVVVVCIPVNLGADPLSAWIDPRSRYD